MVVLLPCDFLRVFFFFVWLRTEIGAKWCNVNAVNSLTHHQARPDCHHHFKPRRKLRHYFCNKSGDGVPIIWFMEFCLIKAVNQYDVVFIR